MHASRALRRRWFLAFALITQGALGLIPASSARAHGDVHDITAPAFLKIEHGEAHLVIRLPLAVFSEFYRFPVNGRELDLANAGPAISRTLADLSHDIGLSENGDKLVASSAVGRLTLPSDRSFESYDEAVQMVAQPMDSGTAIYVDQGSFDANLTYAITSPNSRFAIRTTLSPELGDHLTLVIRYMPIDDEPRSIPVTSRSGTVVLNPTVYDVAATFLVLGFGYIVRNVYYLLFLLALLIPLSGLRQTVVAMATFTLTHSAALLGAAYGSAAADASDAVFSTLLIEAAMAAAIVWVALGNIIGLRPGVRSLATGLSGLVYGIQFSYGLSDELPFAGRHTLISLLSFNLGIEIGQLAVLAIMLPALLLALRYVFAGRVGVIVLCAIIADIAGHWLVDRGAMLWRAPWPGFEAAMSSRALWAVVLLACLGATGIAVQRFCLREGRSGLALLRSVQRGRSTRG
jgi:HupE / UreJ protein